MFICRVCQYNTPKWFGKCPECETWNSFEEHADTKTTRTSSAKSVGDVVSEAIPINEISPLHTERMSTGSVEFDRVLGGGLLQGSVVLLGGEPGIGKSTLVLQTAGKLTRASSVASANNPEAQQTSQISEHADNDITVLYLCTEESKEQVSIRASRLGVSNTNVLISQEYRVEHIQDLVKSHNPDCIIVDSIQALRSLEQGPLAGQNSQLRACATVCCEWSAHFNTAVLFIAHITKEGIIAGPKLIEHMVDTVLMFEKGQHNVRFLHAQKNRYGAVDEVGVLHMTESGLRDISDVEVYFLEERTHVMPSGICVAATYEGTRPFLVELQSLTVPTQMNNRVFSDRIDARQISRVSAVLERHLKLPFSAQNIYVNVAGGMRISEPGLELALALSLYSAYADVPLPPRICAIGELSLPGEIRAVDNFSQRCRQAAEYGFTRVLAPMRNVRELHTELPVEVIGVGIIVEAIDICRKSPPHTTSTSAAGTIGTPGKREKKS